MEVALWGVVATGASLVTAGLWSKLTPAGRVSAVKIGTPVAAFLVYWMFCEPAVAEMAIRGSELLGGPRWAWQLVRLVAVLGPIGVGLNVAVCLAAVTAWWQVTPAQRVEGADQQRLQRGAKSRGR